jgi:UDP-N-acetylglucosamine 2-epimerase (non-hydrolysing)
MIKIFIIVGARPNFIKVAPLFDELKKNKNLKPILIHTGQHYDFNMSKVFFHGLNIPHPDYNLKIGSGLHGEQTGKIMIKLEKICLKENPKLVIVVGDVNSTLASALVSAKLHIPVAHIEAGPRQFDKMMPEEINRILTDHISDFLFCPTQISVKNLKKEGITKGVYNSGDIMYDAFLKNIKIARKRREVLRKNKLKSKSYLLLTMHRPFNVDNKKVLKRILESIAMASRGRKVIFLVHPRIKRNIKYLKNNNKYKNFLFLKPVDYLNMLVLEENAKKIITDSGGVQKEAYFLKVPCITLMNGTGWPETVKSGWNILVGNERKKIINAVNFSKNMKTQQRYFGNGRAAYKIVKTLLLSY